MPVVKISDEAYKKLEKLQQISLGKPSIKSLVEEAIELYYEKHSRTVKE